MKAKTIRNAALSLLAGAMAFAMCGSTQQVQRGVEWADVARSGVVGGAEGAGR